MKKNLIEVAMGKRPADLVIQGGKLVNVLTREIYLADVAILGDRIAAVGKVDHTVGPETAIIEAQGKYLTPGLIDVHLHTHGTQLNIVEFAVAALPRGTTGLGADFYGEAVVGGMQAVRTCLDLARNLPLKVWFMLPTPGYYQNIPFGHSGRPTREDMFQMLDWPECFGMDDTFASKIVAGDSKILELVDAVQERAKKIGGHGSEISGKPLVAWMAYVRASDDHECVDPEEAIEKARLGLHIVMREGSGSPNVSNVIKAVTEYGLDPRRFCFCTDLIMPLHIEKYGLIDNAVRKAIRAGVPPVVAVQMATLNAAECLKVDDDYGSISPGKVADVLLIDDLAGFEVALVIAKGELVAREGRMLKELQPARFPEWAYGTVQLPHPITPEDLVLRVENDQSEVAVRVITATGDSLVTGEEQIKVSVKDGFITTDVQRDLLKVAAIERVQGTREIGVGLVHGFGLQSGAIATTYNSQQQNLVVLGTNDQDMVNAANTLAEVGGGFIAVEQGKVKALLELPLFGLLSDQPYADFLIRLRELNQAVAELGCDFPAPFHTLGFAGLPVDIGTLKISPKGLIDVWQGEVVNLLVS